jgi:hypothetical protein
MGSALDLIESLSTMLAILIVVALDDGRYHWSHVTRWGLLTSNALMIAGFAGVTWGCS